MLRTIELAEWQTGEPGEHKVLAGLSFDQHPAARRLAGELRDRDILTVEELRHGLRIRANSHVGRVQLGPLQITILPKVPFDMLNTLLAYTYQLHHLHLFHSTDHSGGLSTFQDLLIHQLCRETEQLLVRGLQRTYRPARQELAFPRGRIDMARLATRAPSPPTSLPCHVHPRSHDILPNQVLLAGLGLATGLTAGLALRVRLRNLARRVETSFLETSVSPVPLSAAILRQAQTALDRQTWAYRPALALIQLLYTGAGVVQQKRAASSLALPGFLFDMNIFFEALLTRFLTENLSGWQVHAQYRLRELFAYDPAHNPLGRRSPTPRPDLAIAQGGELITLLDAKYRDLWENPLPRDMLYQLALYALSQPQRPRATILYPTLTARAKPQIIRIQNPWRGEAHARIILRPVDLNALQTSLRAPGATGQKQRRDLAHALVFGPGASGDA